MRHNPFEIVRMFEETVADYCGAPYAVSTDNCTDALLICCEYLGVKEDIQAEYDERKGWILEDVERKGNGEPEEANPKAD